MYQAIHSRFGQREYGHHIKSKPQKHTHTHTHNNSCLLFSSQLHQSTDHRESTFCSQYAQVTGHFSRVIVTLPICACLFDGRENLLTILSEQIWPRSQLITSMQVLCVNEGCICVTRGDTFISHADEYDCRGKKKPWQANR